MKRFIPAIILLCTVLFSFQAAAFDKTETAVEFDDVASDSWYAGSVRSAQEFGLMNGVSDNSFSPDTHFTVAQCITVADRLNSSYDNFELVLNDTGTTWYAPYVDYALTKGIITEAQFDSYERNITRAETAVLLCSALPAQAYTQVNGWESIPDVPKDAPYAKAVFTLYNAGILAGNDDVGTFAPDTLIKRSEISAIISRIADDTMRIRKSRSMGDAVYLTDDYNMGGQWGLQSGWKYDNKFQIFNLNGKDSNAASATVGRSAALYREFREKSVGYFQFDSNMRFTKADDGVYISFDDVDKSSAVRIITKDNKFFLEGKELVDTGIAVNDALGNTMHSFLVRIDIDAKAAYCYIDGRDAGNVFLKSDKALKRINIGVSEQGSGSVSVESTRTTMNYAANDNFLLNDRSTGIAPFAGWISSEGITVERLNSENASCQDNFSVRVNAAAGKDASAVRSFITSSGKVCFEANILLPKAESGAYMSLMSGGRKVLTIENNGTSFVSGTTVLRSFTPNIWQCLHIEADTSTGKALVRIDGKDCGTVDFSADSFDGVAIGYNTSNDAVMWFDDVRVNNIIDHADYPSEPVLAPSDDYNVGVNVCNLWRAGHTGEGWDATSPFDELTPYLGFYDEGLPEVADWECKWMAEHGIDFQHICWYSTNNNLTAPIKAISKPQIALNDGYFNAKYSKYVKFCIMWENSGGDVKSLEQFKTYLWPYFKEYYFSDDRYVSLDNKALMTIWSNSKFISSFGGVEGARECVEFMREDIKTLGYDGLIILFGDGGGGVSSSLLDTCASLGVDGTYAYNFGRTGETADYQIGRLKVARAQTTTHYVPTVSVGFNAIGRHDGRTGMIPLDGHKKVCDYIKNDYLGTMNTGTWKDKTFIVSTWNEYSEGTYVMPSALYGFGYLDNIRDAFTSAPKNHEDELPSEASLARMQNLYPENHNPIRWLRWEEEVKDLTAISQEIGKTVTGWDFSKSEDRAKWKNFFGISSYDASGDSIKGTSENSDYAIRLSDPSSFELDISKTAASVLHVRMKTSSAAQAQLFFLTSTDTAWNDKKCITWNQKNANEFADYYVDLSANGNWSGTVTDLRFDPMTMAGSFEITLFEFLNIEVDEADKLKIQFNDMDMSFDFEPYYDEKTGDYMVTANPRQGFFSMSGTYYTYDRYNGVVTIESPSAKAEFTVGSRDVIVSGQKQDLGYEFLLKDGLPLLPLKKLASWLGYTVSENGNTVNMRTLPDDLYEIAKSHSEGKWEFNVDGNLEGWSFQATTGYTSDGIFHCTTTGTDPAIGLSGLSIPASDYTKLVVGVSYKTDRENNSMQLFFLSGSASELSEAYSVKQPLSVSDTKGEKVEITLDLTKCENWKGKVTRLRLDPFNGNGTYDIDYIRFE